MQVNAVMQVSDRRQGLIQAHKQIGALVVGMLSHGCSLLSDMHTAVEANAQLEGLALSTHTVVMASHRNLD